MQQVSFKDNLANFEKKQRLVHTSAQPVLIPRHTRTDAFDNAYTSNVHGTL